MTNSIHMGKTKDMAFCVKLLYNKNVNIVYVNLEG